MTTRNGEMKKKKPKHTVFLITLTKYNSHKLQFICF